MITLRTERSEERVKEHALGDFDQVYQAYCGRIYRLCWRLTLNREEAEDLTLETFGAAYRSREAFLGKSSVETWLYHIAINKWRMFCRKHRHRPVSLHELEIVSPGDLTEDFELIEAIAKLPLPLREAFLLVKGEGLRHHEAAKILKIPMGTVQFRVFQASRELRKHLSLDCPLQEGLRQTRCDHEM